MIELDHKFLSLTLQIVDATRLNIKNFETLTVLIVAMKPLLMHALLSFVDFETKPKKNNY